MHQSLIIGKVLKCLNDDVLIEHWSFTPQFSEVSPSNQPARFSLCTGCYCNDSFITHPSYFPKQQSQVIFRTSLFQLKELARFHYSSNLLLTHEDEADLIDCAVSYSL